MIGTDLDLERKNRYLQDEIDQYREAEDRRLDKEISEARRREKEQRERHEESLRTADDWIEALNKQRILFGREAHGEPYGDNTDDPMEYFFTDGVKACQRAIELWEKLELDIKPQIEELNRQIEALKDGIRAQVADQLDIEGDRPGWKALAGSLRNDSIEMFLYW